MTTLNEIADAVHANAREKGFHDDGLTREQFVERHSNLIHNEVSELHEALRAGKLDSLCDKTEKMLALGLPALTCAEEEYADIVIRALDQCRRLGIDIQRAIEAKHAYNRTREYKHGKKF